MHQGVVVKLLAQFDLPGLLLNHSVAPQYQRAPLRHVADNSHNWEMFPLLLQNQTCLRLQYQILKIWWPFQSAG